MYKLKVDPENPHHYMIGVAMETMRGANPGRMFLKYGPVHFTNDDVEKVGDAAELLKDKIYMDIYKMKPREIYETMECNDIIMSLIGLKLAAQTNHATIHHFSSPCPIPDAEKFFEGYVDRANKNKHEREGLLNAAVR